MELNWNPDKCLDVMYQNFIYLITIQTQQQIFGANNSRFISFKRSLCAMLLSDKSDSEFQ